MIRKQFFMTGLIAWVALSVACASGPSGPPPLDPVGSYSYTANYQGTSITGTMMIDRDDESYGGQITSSLAPPFPVNGVEVMGQAMTIHAVGPEGQLLIEVVMAGTAFEGHFSMGGVSGTLEGTKDPS